jgi:hypothetical protein
LKLVLTTKGENYRNLDKETVATFISGASHPPAGTRADRHSKTLHLEGTGLIWTCNLEKMSAEESILCRFTKKILQQFRIKLEKHMNPIQ